MNVQVFKLVTGEELIAEVEKEEDGMIYCTAPFGVGVNQQGNLVFVPYMPYTSAAKQFVLNRDNVVLMVEPIEQIFNDYCEANSKVLAPRRKSIIAPV